MESQCFPYDWRTGTVFDHAAVTELFKAGNGVYNWPSVAVVYSTSEIAASVEGQSRASAYFAKNPHLTAAVMPPMYDLSSEDFSSDVVLPLMGVEPPVDFRDGNEYGSGNHSVSAQEHDEAAGVVAEAATDGSALVEDMLEITPDNVVGHQENGFDVGGFAYGGDLGGRCDYRPATLPTPGQKYGPSHAFAVKSTQHAGPGGPV